MAFDVKVNEGSLWKNDNMKNEKSAQYTGTVRMECPHCQQSTEYWQSAWVNEAKASGKKFFGQKFNPKEAPKQQAKREAAPDDFTDDSIPF
jgi:hypothetical protein